MLVSALKTVATACHRIVAAGPPTIFCLYIAVLGKFSRLLPGSIGIRIKNSLASSGAILPDCEFTARQVILGQNTKVLLHPHLGEFDGESLFVKHLTYEASQFRWLESQASSNYDTVIEIGANVGIYSVFFDKLCKHPNSRLKRIISFEPSQEAYRRLVANLNVNRARRVTALTAAIGIKSGFQMFYEPKGHLANGSLDRQFAQIMSNDIAAVPVMVLRAGDLKPFFENNERVLVKIDAEGFEAEILNAFGSIIRDYKPDFIIEVLPQTQVGIEACSALAGYRRYLLAERGPEPRATIEASPVWRDWLLSSDKSRR
jgi:FkbM family methyltransferase